MNKNKNEQGYALLIVLFLVAFIMIVSTLFMRASISNAKQGKIVDQNHLSVASAEMGVDYYYTVFMNKFIEIRDEIWAKNYAEYEKEKKQIKSNKNLTNQAQKDKIVALSISYRDKFAEAIKSELEDMSTEPPRGAYYNKSSGGFSITIQDEGTNKYIVIKNKISGVYPGGKSSSLEKELKFPIPLIGNMGGDNASEGGGGDFDIPIVQWNGINDVEEVGIIGEIEVFDNKDNSSGNDIYGERNIVIRKNGDLNKGQIQANTERLDIVATGNINSTMLYGNENISIYTNGIYTTGQIQDNKGGLTISAINGFKSTQIIGGENADVTILTNGRFDTGSIQNNKLQLKITAKDNFISKEITGNKDVSIVTNGEFNSDSIGYNTGQINIKSTGKVQMGNLQYNESVSNVSIETNGSFNSSNVLVNKNLSILANGIFTTGQLHRNVGQTKIRATDSFSSSEVYVNENLSIVTNGSFTTGKLHGNLGKTDISTAKDFDSTEVYTNENLSIVTNGSFTTGQLHGNKGQTKISVADDFRSTEVYANENMSIVTNGTFISGQLQNNKGLLNISVANDFRSDNVYGNVNVSIQTYGDFITGQLRENTGQVKVITAGDFHANEVILRNNSLICVGGNFTVENISSLDATSYLYLIEGHSAVEKIQNPGQIKYVPKSEWENTCGLEVVGGGDYGDSEAKWEKPKLNVEY